LFSRITFAQPVVFGGTGHFRNTDHFLEMDAGYSGCLRNLEINDKMYNFNAAANGGDVAEGRDIGKFSPLLHRFRNVYIFCIVLKRSSLPK
jgi:hypothetical protein